MVLAGRVQNGVVIPDGSVELPEGALVRIEVPSVVATQLPRTGGCWHGRVVIAADFDQLPDDLAEAFGATA